MNFNHKLEWNIRWLDYPQMNPWWICKILMLVSFFTPPTSFHEFQWKSITSGTTNTKLCLSLIRKGITFNGFTLLCLPPPWRTHNDWPWIQERKMNQFPFRVGTKSRMTLLDHCETSQQHPAMVAGLKWLVWVHCSSVSNKYAFHPLRLLSCWW